MKIEDITIEIRSVALGRLGQVDLSEIEDLKIIKRFRNVGNWSMSLPADYEGAGVLAQAGRGLVVTGPDDRVLMSGPVASYVKQETSDDSDGVWYFEGTDDMVHLADGLCFPTPSAAVNAQVDAYDVFAGNAEDALRHYVNVNRGPGAVADRRIDGLVLEPASLGRGALVIGRARFEQMGPFLDRLASSGGVGFDIAQVGTELQFQVYTPSDVSDAVRMDIANDMLEETQYGFSAPSATRPVIAGQGEMTSRLFLQKTSLESVVAESAWGRKIEVFKDRRDTPDLAELEQEADTILAKGGKTATSLSVRPADENTMRFAVDWYLGDIVGVIVDGQELTSIVTEAIISIDTDGIRISATIGDPSGFDFESKMIARAQDQEKRIQNMEKNNGSITWNTLPDKPATFPSTWSEVASKPATFPPSGHSHSASEITSGIIGNPNLPEPIRLSGKTITNANDAMENGWYMGSNVANAPGGYPQWHYYEVIRHNPDWVYQRAFGFGPAHGNNTIWQRWLSNGTWSAWERTDPYSLPDAQTVTGGSINTLSSTSAASPWTVVPSVAEITIDFAQACWVDISIGAWMQGASGDMRCGASVRGATTMAENEPAWGATLWASGAYEQRSATKKILVNAGVNIFRLGAYRASGSGSVNYPFMTVTPVRWAS